MNFKWILAVALAVVGAAIFLRSAFKVLGQSIEALSTAPARQATKSFPIRLPATKS